MKKLMASQLAPMCDSANRRLLLFLALQSLQHVSRISSNVLTMGSAGILLPAQWRISRQPHILFAHLYLREGLVVAADVEQAVSLRKQPTKIEKKTVSTCNKAVNKFIYIYIYVSSIFQLVTESRNVR